MQPAIEPLEPRRLAASLAYSLQAPEGPVQVGQLLEVGIIGRAVYDVPTTPAGVFSWGVDVSWNSQWLGLVDVSLAADYDWLPLMEPFDGTDSTDALQLGGLLDAAELPISGDGQVLLAAVTLRVLDAKLPGTLTGLQLAAGQRPSAIIGIDDYVAADVSGAWLLWDVAAQPGHNQAMPADVDGDEAITPRDALLAVNAFLRDGPQPATAGPYMLDVDGDGVQSSPADVLAIFAALSQTGQPDADT